MFLITTHFLRLYLFNMDKSCNGSGNHAPVNFKFSETTMEIQPMAVVKGWVVHSVLHLEKPRTPWNFKSAGVSSKMENVFSINNAAHSVLLSLDSFSDFNVYFNSITTFFYYLVIFSYTTCGFFISDLFSYHRSSLDYH